MARANSSALVASDLQVLDDESRRIARQQVAAPAVDGAARGFHPVHEIGVAIRVGFVRERAHQVDQRRGALRGRGEIVVLGIQACGRAAAAPTSRSANAVSTSSRVMVCPGMNRNSRNASRARSSASVRPGDGLGRGPRILLPLAEGAGQRDQVRGEIAGVHRGDVARLERPQVLGVVPVVEMAVKRRHARQRVERRPRCDRAHRAGRTSRSRAPRRWTAGTGRCWWARCGARPRRADLPGNCPAAGDCLPP